MVWVDYGSFWVFFVIIYKVMLKPFELSSANVNLKLDAFKLMSEVQRNTLHITCNSVNEVQNPSCLGGRKKRHLNQKSEISKRSFPALCM